MSNLRRLDRQPSTPTYAGLCHYIPCNLGEIPDYYRRFIDPPDIAVFKTCAVDERGFFNLSAANLWHRVIGERAKIVIVESCGQSRIGSTATVLSGEIVIV